MQASSSTKPTQADPQSHVTSFANMIADLAITKYQQALSDGHNWCQVAKFYMSGAHPDESLIYWGDGSEQRLDICSLIINYSALNIAYEIITTKHAGLKLGCVFHKRERSFGITAIWVDEEDLSLDGVPDYYLFMGKQFPCGPERKFTGTPEQWEHMRNFKVKRAFSVTCPHCGRQNYHNGPDGHRACDALSYACPGYIWCA